MPRYTAKISPQFRGNTLAESFNPLGMKKFKYKGQKSEVLDPIVFDGYEILSLKHGNTGHVLYLYPSDEHGWEGCWTMDLQTAKNGVTKYLQHVAETGAV